MQSDTFVLPYERDKFLRLKRTHDHQTDLVLLLAADDPVDGSQVCVKELFRDAITSMNIRVPSETGSQPDSTLTL